MQQRREWFLLVVRGADQLRFFCGISKDLLQPPNKLRAGDLVRESAAICGGSGGGRDDFAQAGGNHPENLPKAIQTIKNHIRNKMAT